MVRVGGEGRGKGCRRGVILCGSCRGTFLLRSDTYFPKKPGVVLPARRLPWRDSSSQSRRVRWPYQTPRGSVLTVGSQKLSCRYRLGRKTMLWRGNYLFGGESQRLSPQLHSPFATGRDERAAYCSPRRLETQKEYFSGSKWGNSTLLEKERLVIEGGDNRTHDPKHMPCRRRQVLRSRLGVQGCRC